MGLTQRLLRREDDAPAETNTFMPHELPCDIHFLEVLGVTRDCIDRFPNINNDDYHRHFEDLQASPIASFGTIRIEGKYVTQPKKGTFKKGQWIPGGVTRWKFEMYGPHRNGYSLEIERIE